MNEFKIILIVVSPGDVVVDWRHGVVVKILDDPLLIVFVVSIFEVIIFVVVVVTLGVKVVKVVVVVVKAVVNKDVEVELFEVLVDTDILALLVFINEVKVNPVAVLNVVVEKKAAQDVFCRIAGKLQLSSLNFTWFVSLIKFW